MVEMADANIRITPWISPANPLWVLAKNKANPWLVCSVLSLKLFDMLNVTASAKSDKPCKPMVYIYRILKRMNELERTQNQFELFDAI